MRKLNNIKHQAGYVPVKRKVSCLLTSNVPNLVLIGIMVLNVVIAVAAVMFPAWKMGRENIIDEIRG